MNESDFELDQRRVDEDEHMKALLAEWRGLLQEPPVVRVYRSTKFA